MAGPGFGQDTITDFNVTKDVIQFNPSLFANYAAVLPSINQSGANTVISYDANDTITLSNVTASTLTQKNFAFA